jgi:hypothetical protein
LLFQKNTPSFAAATAVVVFAFFKIVTVVELVEGPSSPLFAYLQKSCNIILIK